MHFFSFSSLANRHSTQSAKGFSTRFLNSYVQKIQNCSLAFLLATISSLSLADVIEVKDAQLTMNEELSKDVHQTLYHLQYGHYLPNELNDEYSARTLDGYLELLDPNKVYFTLKDIEVFDVYRDKLDD